MDLNRLINKNARETLKNCRKLQKNSGAAEHTIRALGHAATKIYN